MIEGKMGFALLGDHPDGLALAQALVDGGRRLVAVSASLGAEALRRLGSPRVVPDAEEILADPSVDLVVVAGGVVTREQQLRRSLQSERDVICVHLDGEKPDIAYEAAMIRDDVKKRLAPILPEALHPALGRLAEFIDREGGQSPLGAFRLLSIEHSEDHLVAYPWGVLRRLGGEVGEVSAFAQGETVAASDPVLLSGRFERGGLFQATLVPGRPSRLRLGVVGECGEAALTFPQGYGGPAFLNHGGNEEAWPAWDMWPAVAAAIDSGELTWQDEVRALELDDAARRSVERRRAHAMEYQEASEEVGFKGTMALAGCALLWGVILLLVVAVWVPWVGWLILPLLLVFVAMQMLRYALPARSEDGVKEWPTDSVHGKRSRMEDGSDERE